MFFSSKKQQDASPQFTYKDPNSKAKSSSLFDDYSVLMSNMSSLHDLELDKLSVDDHIEGIKFYSYLKFKRMIDATIKNEI